MPEIILPNRSEELNQSLLMYSNSESSFNFP